jgi:predicted RNA-binding Zn-ribbon protein involved in translation (DUF1610 family)
MLIVYMKNVPTCMKSLVKLLKPNCVEFKCSNCKKDIVINNFIERRAEKY